MFFTFHSCAPQVLLILVILHCCVDLLAFYSNRPQTYYSTRIYSHSLPPIPFHSHVLHSNYLFPLPIPMLLIFTHSSPIIQAPPTPSSATPTHSSPKRRILSQLPHTTRNYGSLLTPLSPAKNQLLARLSGDPGVPSSGTGRRQERFSGVPDVKERRL